jgi:hypothetical protein
VFCNPSIDVDSIYDSELVDSCLEGRALGIPVRDVTFLEKEARGGDQRVGLGGLCRGGAVEDDDIVGQGVQ